MLWHNGWRDARVTHVLGEVEGVREYGVKFERLQGGEGEETVQFLQVTWTTHTLTLTLAP